MFNLRNLYRCLEFYTVVHKNVQLFYNVDICRSYCKEVARFYGRHCMHVLGAFLSKTFLSISLRPLERLPDTSTTRHFGTGSKKKFLKGKGAYSF